MVLHYPSARLGVVVGEEGNAHVGAVHVRERAAYADDAAPAAGAYDRPQPGSLETPREEVAVGSAVFVDQHHLRAGVGSFGNCADKVAAALHGQAVSLPLQTLDEHRRYISTAVATVIHDEGFLVELRIIVAGELLQTFSAHVGNVDVADLAAGKFVDLADIVLDPLVMHEGIFVSYRFDNHLAAAGSG